MKLISVVIPMKNEAEGIGLLFEALDAVLAGIDMAIEIVAVDDGSTDSTVATLRTRQETDKRIRIVSLSRNFGKEAALTAGLGACRGDAAITIDSDLQHPPNLIREMIEKWLEGFDMVVAVRSSGRSEPWLKRITANTFYRLFNSVSDISIIPNAGDYRLLDRYLVDTFLSLSESARFNKGLFSWLGGKTCLIHYELTERAVGTTKWNFVSLWRLALDGITSFSCLPLRIWNYIGFLVAFTGIIWGVCIAVVTLGYGRDVPGYASIICTILFLGGINLLGIGMLGEYIARIFQETKRRPLYVIRRQWEPTNNGEQDVN